MVKNINAVSYKKSIIISVLLSLCFLCFAAVIHTVVSDGKPFINSLFTTNADLIWIWVLFCIAFIAYGLYSTYLIKKHSGLQETNSLKNTNIISETINEDKSIPIDEQETIFRNYETEAAVNLLLRLSLADITIEKLLNEALRLILSISWLSFESKGCIFLADDEGKFLNMKANYGLGNYITQTCSKLPFGKCLCGRAALDRGIVYSDCLDPRHEVTYPEIHAHGHYCVPIMSGDKVLGVINMYLAAGYKYNTKDTDFLLSIANTLAGVIERKRAEQELKHRVEFEQVLSHISAKFVNVKTIENEAEIENALKISSEFLKAQSSFIYLLSSNKVTAELSHSFIDGPSNTLQMAKSIKINEFQWFVVKLRKLENIMADLPMQEAEFYSDLIKLIGKDTTSIKTVIIVPLLFKDTLRGFFGYVFKDKHPYYNAHDLSLMRVLGELLINAIEQRRLEIQFNQSQKMETIGRLSGSIAHDLNNLMTPIIGYSQLLLNSMKKDSPFRDDTKEIYATAERASALTKQLLAFSRRQALSPEIIDMNKTISGLEKMLKRMIGDDILLTINEDKSLWNVKVDPGQIEQVITNLVLNAKDAMKGIGEITITTVNTTFTSVYNEFWVDILPGNYVKASIADTGSGMSDEVKSHLFEPFFTTKEKGKGTGLGLATSYGIIKQSGGYITLKSEPGKGTVFSIYLPASEEKAAARAPSIDIVKQTKGTETILLAEDDNSVRMLAVRVLREQGYVVIEARDGAEAMQMFNNYNGANIHMLLTDAVMPKLSGIELALNIRKTKPEIKVLAFSGFPNMESEVLAISNARFLQKPFSPFELLAKVRETLSRN